MKEKPGAGKLTGKNVYPKAFIHKIMSCDIYAHIIHQKMFVHFVLYDTSINIE